MTHRHSSVAHLAPRPEEEAFLRDIVANPGDESVYLILADWLEEYDDPRRAELLRLHRRLLATCCEPDEHPERAAWQERMVALQAAGVCPCVPRIEEAGMIFAWCPPGTFLMGSPESEAERSDDETQHRVTLSKGFWLGVTPVTQAQWQAILGSNPSNFKGEDRPVEQVSWEDCQAFCTKLRERTGKTFRLPTEAEWEYACRAGTATPFSFGATITPDQVNYDGNYPYSGAPKGVYRQQTTPVGSFPANDWGLYDMHGNVYEWCADWFGQYSSSDQKDPVSGNNGDARVLRGGSWGGYARWCRSACRRGDAPSNRYVDVGCRLVLCLD
jgi:sulfatase modifying factor 1